MREPLTRRIIRWIAWACVVLILVAMAGGILWAKLLPFLPLLAFIAMVVALAWFAFGRRGR